MPGKAKAKAKAGATGKPASQLIVTQAGIVAVDWWSPQGDEGIEGGYRRRFLEILSLGSVCVSPDAVY